MLTENIRGVFPIQKSTYLDYREGSCRRLSSRVGRWIGRPSIWHRRLRAHRSLRRWAQWQNRHQYRPRGWISSAVEDAFLALGSKHAAVQFGISLGGFELHRSPTNDGHFGETVDDTGHVAPCCSMGSFTARKHPK